MAKEEPSPLLSTLSTRINTWVEQFATLQRLRLPRFTTFAQQEAGVKRGIAKLEWRTVLLEWALILVVVLSFCWGFLDLGTRRPLPGNEAEVFQSLDWVLVHSLRRYGEFPLWNPYLHTGLPFVADPMLHVYNPLVTIPVLLFGVLDGFKIALFLSFLAAGLGMWWLGVVLGMGRAGRLWMAGMYAFSGPAVARFFQGQYLFVLGFAWIPWVLGSLLAVAQTRRRLHAAMAALAMALLFFSGNVYYAYYMLFVIGLYGLVMLFEFRPRPVLNRDRTVILLTVGVLAAGLIAVQLLPLLEFWPRISKATNPQLTDSQTFRQILLDYVSKDRWRADAIKAIPSEEFYAYIGIWPFLALVLLPLAVWKRDKRPLLFFGLLLAFAVAWISVRDMPWRELYTRVSFLNQFRYPTRMLIYGACAIIVLAGSGMDSLWKLLRREAGQEGGSGLAAVRQIAARAGILLLAGFMIWSVADVYTTNKQHIRTREPYEAPYSIMRWLRRFDASEYYVSDPTNKWHGAILSNGLRFIDAWYHFGDIRPLSGVWNRRPIQARPHYQVLSNDKTPEFPDPIPVQRFETHTVYRLPHSLPLAFAVENEKLLNPTTRRELQSEDVIALTPLFPSPNRIEIIAQGNPNSTLVVLTTYYPGWRITVDGRRQALKNVSGYLATDLRPGVHRYVFSFYPFSFAIGLVISIIALIVSLGLLISDLHVNRQQVKAEIDAIRRWLAGIRAWRPPFEAPPRPAPGPPASQPSEPVVASSRAARATLEAVYQDGVLKPTAPLDLAENTRVRIRIEEGTAAPKITIPDAIPSTIRRWLPTSATWPARLSAALTLEGALFILALLVYAITRLRGLDRFPIYFFADEAIQTLLAEDLIARGFRDPRGGWLPLYFEAAGLRWTPLLSVYFHALTAGLFGKSIFVTRATSAVISMAGAAAVAFTLKLIFKARFWWTGVLFMAVTPAWFLHSRTAFETVMMTSFYACFLLSYLLYRYRSPRYLYAALVFGAATFYSYSNGQVVIVAAGLLLFFSDIRYHLRHWRVALPGLLLIAVLAWPAISFRLQQPGALETHLRAINSYWFQAIPLQEKLTLFAQKYAYGLSPQYWFFPNNHDLARHRMKGYGHMRIELLPLVLVGIGLCLWRFRSSRHRAILLAALATPAGAALLDVGITRVLAFVVPASILAGLGLEVLLTRLTRRISYNALASVVFLILYLASLAMLRNAFREGPLWFRDYGLYGMQYGAKQLFQEAIPQYLAQDPNVRLMVSSSWANGAHVFIRFFLPPEQQWRVQMRGVDSYLFEKLPLDDNTVLVMTPSEYERARTSPKFKRVAVERIIPYPDGRPGFYFARLAYADNVDAIFAAEREARRRPVEEEVELDGQTVRVIHSRFDMGQARHMFDGDRFTLARVMEANPAIVELIFPQPRTLTGLAADFATMDFSLTVRLYENEESEPISYTAVYRGLPPDPHVELAFDRGPHTVTRMRIEIKDLRAGEVAKIHIRELTLR